MGDYNDLLSLAGKYTPLRWAASTKGGEYAGPCPLPGCQGGDDRFRVWPNHPSGRPQWWCRGCKKTGDGISLLVELGELTPADAGRLRRDGRPWPGTTPAAPRLPVTPKHGQQLAPPCQDWQAAARAFCEYAQEQLWKTPAALDWLRGRGLADDTIRAAGLGWNPADLWRAKGKWGLEHRADIRKIRLPRGWVIPWEIDGQLWRVNVRRTNEDIEQDRRRKPNKKPAKYIGPAGFANGLYNAGALAPDKPAILVEGEFDALTLGQAAGDLVAPVATGSTEGSRRPRWIARLALCPLVLVSFDTDKAGTEAAAWWVDVLSNAQRWRPLWADANAMAQDGADLRGWVVAALETSTVPSDPPTQAAHNPGAPTGRPWSAAPAPTEPADLDARLDAVAVALDDQERRLDALDAAHVGGPPVLARERPGPSTAAAPTLETDPEIRAGGILPSTAATYAKTCQNLPAAAPAWSGQRVRIEDLPEFAARWGLVTVGGDPDLDGQPWAPTVHYAEVGGGQG